jgi:hypothetical protein
MAPPTHCNWRLQPGATIYASMVYQKNQSRRQPRHHDAANKPHTLVNLNINDEGRRRRPPTAAAGATAGEAGTTARVPTATAAAARQSTTPLHPATQLRPAACPPYMPLGGSSRTESRCHHRWNPRPVIAAAPRPAEPPRRQIRRRRMQIRAKTRADPTSRTARVAAVVATMPSSRGGKGGRGRWRTVGEPAATFLAVARASRGRSGGCEEGGGGTRGWGFARAAPGE